MSRRKRSASSEPASSPATRPAPRRTPANEPTRWSLLGRAGDRALLAMLLGLVFLLGCYDLTDGDYWWHLRTGRLIWERGAVPRVNEFAYTNPDTPWIDLHWLFQLGLYGLHSLGGVALPILVKSLLGAVVIGIAWATGRPGWPTWQGVALWLPAVIAFTGRFDVRPEILTLLAIAATMWVLVRSETRPAWLWALPFIQLLWVNVQGLFVLGPLILGAWLLDAAIRRPAGFAWKTWLAVYPLTVAACFANPYGLEGALFPLVLQERIQGPNHEFYKAFAGEFASFPDFVKEAGFAAVFSNVSPLTQLAVFAAGVVTFVALALRGRFSPFRLILFAAFAYLVYQANRNSVLFALVGGLVVYWNQGELSELAAARSPAGSRERADDELAAEETATRMRLGLGVLLFALLISTPWGVVSAARGMGPESQQPRTFGLGVAEWVPFDAVELLALEGMPRRVFADHLGMASLYMERCGPERKVFADPRLEANSPEALAKSLEFVQRLARRDPRAEEVLLEKVPPGPDGSREMPALLIDAGTLFKTTVILAALSDHPHWRCVFLDPRQGGVFLWDDQVARLKIEPTIDLKEVLREIEAARAMYDQTR